MSPNTRKKLARNMEYHAAMADYYGSKGKDEKPAAKSDAKTDTKPTASARPPAMDQNKVLAALHAGVVKQLQHVLATPEIPGILVAQANQPVQRNPSPDVRPAAGRFH